MVRELRISTGEAGRGGRIPFPRMVKLMVLWHLLSRLPFATTAIRESPFSECLEIAVLLLGFLTWSPRLQSREETLLSADETRIRGCKLKVIWICGESSSIDLRCRSNQNIPAFLLFCECYCNRIGIGEPNTRCAVSCKDNNDIGVEMAADRLSRSRL